MSGLSINTLDIHAAKFDDTPNPLPPLKSLSTISWPISINDDVPLDDRKYLNYACKTPLLPYILQTSYNHDRQIRTFKTFVLENKYLKATFLAEFGGRLWSLFYKPEKRELLYVNPVFQPANLAYRDAWFSGGVEWNMGMPAHSPFTCDRPFFSVIEDRGTTYLRMYEWERVRNAPFQVDFYLPSNSPFLHVRTKLINPYNYKIPGYWFSNIAVPEDPRHRVIVPANKAYTFDYSSERCKVKTTQIPICNGDDVSYPSNVTFANDFFFRLDDSQWPWIASLDADGSGLVQASTSKLKGRKMFVWGMGTGGRRWQEFLSEPGHPYIEIQAGFGRTQAECLPLAPHSETEWLEVYGYIKTDPNLIHGLNWQAACHEVENKLSRMTTLPHLEEELAATKDLSDKHSPDILQYGSGWGALERQAAGIAENKVFAASGLFFPDDSITTEQQPWQALLRRNDMPPADPQKPVDGYQASNFWKKLLQKSIKSGKSRHWLAYYHLGIMNYTDGLYQQANDSIKKSLALMPTLWSYRLLAFIETESGNVEETVNAMQKAWEIGPVVPEFVEEYGQVLVLYGRYDTCEKMIMSLDKNITERWRVKILEAKIALAHGDFEKVENILSNTDVVNIRECETTLTDLWFEAQAYREATLHGCAVNDNIRLYVSKNLLPPRKIDFRMNVNE